MLRRSSVLPMARSCGITILLVCCLTLVSHAQQPSETPATPEATTQAQDQPPPAQQASTQETHATKHDTQANVRLDEPVPVKYARMLLVVFVLLVLGYLFWVMIVYSNRIAQTGPLGIQITDALDEVRKQGVKKALNEKWETEEYYKEIVSDREWMSAHAVPAVPDELKGDWGVGEARRQLLQRGRIGSLPPGFDKSSSDAEEEAARARTRREYLETLRSLGQTYEAEAKRRHTEEQRTLSARPQGKDKNIISYFDFPSVAGQGPEFVLRFTALVTIIFAVIALSILGLLDPDQAGTILAAIAGYVLGQASARAARGGTEEPAQPAKVTQT